MSAKNATTPQGSPTGSSLPHPFDQLSVAETNLARQVVLDARGNDVAIKFRSIALDEPPKKELWEFLEVEHAGKLTTETHRPSRQAKVQYDVVRSSKDVQYSESIVNVVSATETHHRVVNKVHQPALTT